MIKRFSHLVALAGGLAAWAGGAAATSLDYVFSDDDIRVGDAFTVTLMTAEDTGDFTGFWADPTFDMSILRLDTRAATIGSVFPTFRAGGDDQSRITGAVFGTTLSGRQTLGSFAFEALAPGTTDVVLGTPSSFVGLLTSDDVSSPVLLAAGAPSGTFTVTVAARAPDGPSPVPLPASGVLLLAGLGLLPAIRRRLS